MTTKSDSEHIDKYLARFWGDYPALAASLYDRADLMVKSVVVLAQKDDVDLDPDAVADRMVAILDG